MSRLPDAFKGGKAFIAFVTGGDPDIETTEKLIAAMISAGADLIEIGVPFSDPIAEGPVIQRANIRAVSGGAALPQLFEMTARLRGKFAVPFVFLIYLNTMLRYGYEAFFANCAESGLDGVIIPDLPFEEHCEVKSIAAKRGVDVISLVAPTSAERIEKIAAEASGFLYVVSSTGVTGARAEITTDLGAMIKSAKAVSDIPCAVGFGVSTPEQAREISRTADGVIVGSAIVRIVEEHGRNAEKPVFDYVRRMKEAMV
jgi:tryptophan synthase alpha chain